MNEMNPLHAVHEQVSATLADCGTPMDAACLNEQDNTLDYFGDFQRALPDVISLVERCDWVRFDQDDGDVRMTRDGLRIVLRAGFLTEEVRA